MYNKPDPFYGFIHDRYIVPKEEIGNLKENKVPGAKRLTKIKKETTNSNQPSK